MSASACLVTSSPTFEDPPATKPFLEFETAQPDPRNVLILNENIDLLTFEAFVRSEDVGQKVEVRLLLDYGTCNALQQPFLDSFDDADVAAGTFDEKDRLASVRYATVNLDPGCHRLTLMASHAFDGASGCPVDEEDFTQITWTVFRCAGDDCGAFNPASCPPIEASCTNFAICKEPL